MRLAATHHATAILRQRRHATLASGAAFLLCLAIGGAARADNLNSKPLQQTQRATTPVPAQSPPSSAQAAGQAAQQRPAAQTAAKAKRAEPPPLSEEDAALVRELSLVENAELLQHLELFDAQAQTEEPPPDHAAPPARAQ